MSGNIHATSDYLTNEQQVDRGLVIMAGQLDVIANKVRAMVTEHNTTGIAYVYTDLREIADRLRSHTVVAVGPIIQGDDAAEGDW